MERPFLHRGQGAKLSSEADDMRRKHAEKARAVDSGDSFWVAHLLVASFGLKRNADMPLIWRSS